MNSDDRKEIVNIVNQGFEAVMLPYFARVQEGIDAIREDVAVIKDTLQDHGNRLARIEVRQENDTHRLDRIEGKLDAVVDRQVETTGTT